MVSFQQQKCQLRESDSETVKKRNSISALFRRPFCQHVYMKIASKLTTRRLPNTRSNYERRPDGPISIFLHVPRKDMSPQL